MTRNTADRSRIVLGLVFVAIVVFAVWKGWSDDAESLPETLNVYCFSGMEPVMRDAILPAFVAGREAATGRQVELITVYAGSGTITERIMREFPAGIAILASEVDADRLLARGVVGVSWKRLPHGGILARSPLVLAVRPGNPHRLATYADLARPGLGVVLADPHTSGLGEWTVLAVHGADAAAGEARVAALWSNAPARERSAQSAIRAFVEGAGDATLGYAASLEAVADVEIVYPEPTFMAEHVVVRIDRNLEPEQRDLADAFIEFLWGPDAQQLLADHGLYSVDPARNTGLRPLDRVATLEDLGGTRAARQLLRRLAPPE